MKRVRLVFLVLLGVAALALVAAACGSGPDTAPRFSLHRENFNFGTIYIGKPVQKTIGFENLGKEPLRVSILKVRPDPKASCGCGVDRYEVKPKVVQPGQKGELVFNLKAPEGMPIMQDVMLAHIQTNDPDKQSMTLKLTFQMAP